MLNQSDDSLIDVMPGMLGDTWRWVYSYAPYQNQDLALATSITFLSGILGRNWNVSGTGLNQYILIVAKTGAGKDQLYSAPTRLLARVAASVPLAYSLKGPSEIASSQGLVRWLSTSPIALCCVGEFGHKLKDLASPKANAVNHGLERIFLVLYSKSGNGELLDPMAYADRQKNTAPINSPSFTLAGETTPEKFTELLDEQVVSSGLLPRFMVFMSDAPRQYENQNRAIEPPEDLVGKLSDICAKIVPDMMSAQVHSVTDVLINHDAKTAFDEFEKLTTDRINNGKSEAASQLWNRAKLKALKLAAVGAVGVNHFKPIIDSNWATWAIRLISSQTEALIAKFESGRIGEIAGNQAMQHEKMTSLIAEFLNSDFEKFESYGVTPEIHGDGIIPHNLLLQRLRRLSAFKNDRIGANRAIERTVQEFLQDDALREIPKHQMQQRYASMPRSYAVARPSSFKIPTGGETMR